MISLYPYILDSILIVSLIVTIFCCIILYRKLKDIRKSEKEIKKVISEFTLATERASTSLLSLKKSGSDLTQFMQEKITEAKSVVDELKFLSNQTGYVSKKTSIPVLKKQNIKVHSPPISLRSEMEKELITALEQSR